MYASVLIQYGAKSLDKVFTYHIPDNLADKVSVGMRVSVPFNKKNINGFVMSIESKCESDYEILDIIDVVNESFKLNDELIHLMDKFFREKEETSGPKIPIYANYSISKNNQDLVQEKLEESFSIVKKDVKKPTISIR